MKLLLLSFFLFLAFTSKSQYSYQQWDSLKRYSYQISAFAKRTIDCGTGFFVKSQQGTYVLVTAHHVLTDASFYGATHRHVEKVLIKIPGYGYYNLRVHVDSILKVNPVDSMHKKADLIFYELKGLPQKIRINTINHFLSDSLPRLFDIVMSYGFGGNNMIPGCKGIVNGFEGVVDRAIKDKTQYANGMVADSLNYIISANVLNGHSGAPVFYKRNGKILLAGMCIAGWNDEGLGLILKPTILLKELARYNLIRLAFGEIPYPHVEKEMSYH